MQVNTGNFEYSRILSQNNFPLESNKHSLLIILFNRKAPSTLSLQIFLSIGRHQAHSPFRPFFPTGRHQARSHFKHKKRRVRLTHQALTKSITQLELPSSNPKTRPRRFHPWKRIPMQRRTQLPFVHETEQEESSHDRHSQCKIQLTHPIGWIFLIL